MEALLGIFTFIQGLGVSVMMPIIITIIGVCLGGGFSKSLKAGLMVGVGFIGLTLVINNLLGVNLAPAVETMVERFGLSLSIIDVGWPASAAIAMGSTIGSLIIPLGLLVNVIMLLTNTTQTVDVDIWNYWHFAFTGSIVAIITDNLAFGFAAAVINMVIVLILGDITAPQVEKSLGMPGVSLPHGFTAAFAPIAMAVNALIDRIPGVRDINLDVEAMQRKFGVFGEPLFVGTVIGIVIGAVAYFDPADVAGSITKILVLGISLGAVLVLIPRMASLLMEGLLPISDAASEFIQKRLKNRGRIYIGLDSAVGVGNPVTLSMALILIPVMLLLAVVLQPLGNQVIPFGDLATATYMLVLVTPIVGQNGFRGLIVGVVVLAIGLLISTYMAPFQTTAALQSGFDIAKYAGTASAQISSLCDGANPLTFIFVFLGDMNGWLCLGVTGVGAAALALWNRSRILKEARELHDEMHEAA
ncbi:PTS sugar transporter subunit IIC [Collinsella sp. AGMB00827]|uniref:PTS sugar transporter subunit IIC n=1 Tax=Collinsella ureilytica TaxID=2869515 RepID=A0ABS7MKJ2_9ACTN|nr:PTS transporter subunit IIC [Collinsella urealyticum]MBY4797558.1 PTS sugar transporter subunit IIC [Collinsella urealyticum]